MSQPSRLQRLLLSCAVLLAARLPVSAEVQTLRFRADGTFRIVQFADLHYGEGEDVPWGPAQDRNSTRVMDAVRVA